ncbi:MAG: hypothetical protein ACOX0E_07600 [Syntrophomonadaceae bacterium]
MDENQYLDKILDKEILLAIFSDDKEKAKKQYIEFMNETNDDKFIDLQEEKQIMDEDAAKLLFEQMSAGQDNNQELIREFKQRTNLSLRQIAAITGINKDKVNKFLREG